MVMIKQKSQTIKAKTIGNVTYITVVTQEY